MDLIAMQESEAALIEGKKCVKCPELAKYAGVDPKKAVYCRPCFIHMVKSKFRSTLSKRRIFKDGENRETLVVFDGTSSAAFLLHQIEDAIKQISYKRLMIKPTMLVLVSTMDVEKIPAVEEKVITLKSILPGTRWIIVHLAGGLGDSVVDEQEGCQSLDHIPRLADLLSSCKSATARAELLRIVRERVCAKAAIACSSNKVMLPDDGDVLGRLALAQLCLGRGASVSELTSVLDKRPSGISFVRPLRDVSQKEISIVNHLEGYESSTIRLENTPQTMTGSIHSITSSFVDNLLNEGFKSTVTTVLSTAGKLHLLPSDIICPLCQLGAVEQSSQDVCASCADLLAETSCPELIRNMLL